MTDPCDLRFTLDGVVLGAQPLSVQLHEAEPERRETLRGYFASRAQEGRIARVEWGALPAYLMGDIRSLMDARGVHSLSWIEPDGTTVSLAQAIPEAEETEWSYFEAPFYRPFSLVFMEAQPDP